MDCDPRRDNGDDVSSSNSLTTKDSCSYDVFLSFSGQDTRFGFTGNLFDALCRQGIRAFMDKNLKRGDEISDALHIAIESSEMAVVVFSENYAESTWCLDELAKIVECKNSKKQSVRPIFYGVDPADVRYGRNGYGKALAQHEENFKVNEGKVRCWRSALVEVANLAGWVYKDRYEYEFIREVTTEIFATLKNTIVKLDKSLVGLESRISEVKSLLETSSNNQVSMIGICGFGGMGKTTIAQGLYNSLRHLFEAKCFLSNVSEKSSKGLVKLQEKLLAAILGHVEINLEDVEEGKSLIEQRFRNIQILLILDDVDALEQLEALAGGHNWFGNGSKIVITTRDRHLLACHGISNDKIWEARGLIEQEAFKLFSWVAFKRSEPNPTHAYIAKHVVEYSKGVPLLLRVIGSDLSGRHIDKWESALTEYERLPKKGIHDVLKISYDHLDDIEKEIFLDIACFFKGTKLGYVKEILDRCDFCTDIGIQKLMDKSLLSIDDNDRIWMHDVIEEMGKKIVQQESPLDPSKRSRLWDPKDILYVLKGDLGTEKIQGILLECLDKVKWSGEAFRNMINLRILIIRKAKFSKAPKHLPGGLRFLEWSEYPSKSLPKDFNGENHAVLKIRKSHNTRDLLQKVSAVSSLLGRAGYAGIGKAVDVLDTLGSSMTTLNSNFTSGVTSKGNKLSILAFEVANTITKGANLMESLSKENVKHLKEVVLQSEGVQHLISRDMDELLRIAVADKREELEVFYSEIRRFGDRCVDPQWHNLYRRGEFGFWNHNEDPHCQNQIFLIEKLSSGRKPQKQFKEEAEAVMTQLMTLVQYTAELYHELNAFDRFHQDYFRKRLEEDKPNTTQEYVGDSLAILRAELKTQMKHVRILKKKSLWCKVLEEVMEKLVDTVRHLHFKIHDSFGITDGDTQTKSSQTNKRLGSAGLALHYANIITQIDTIIKLLLDHNQVSRSSSVPQNMKDSLYQGLPPSIKSTLRSRLASFQPKLTIPQIKAVMEETLQWLVPIANNTIKAQHHFGCVGELANTVSEVNRNSASQTNLLRIETLHHADKEKTEAYILELIVWLHYLVSQVQTANGRFRCPVKPPIRSPTQKTLQLCAQKPNSPSTELTVKDQQMLDLLLKLRRARARNSTPQDIG